MTTRSKSNLAPPIPVQIILGAEERKAYLCMVDLWRIYAFYFEGLQELAA